MSISRRSIFGVASLATVIAAWCALLFFIYSGVVGWRLANTMLTWISVAAYVGGIALAVGAFVRRERKLWPVLTLVLLAVSPGIMILLAIWAWALV